MLLGFEKLSWKNVIHVSKIKPNWQIPLEMVKNYITSEGRYDRVLKCHLRLLMHLNLPFYLFKILQRMVTWVQTHPEHTARSIYHHGLIKLLVVSHLNKDGRNWDSFLLQSGFEEIFKEKGKKSEISYKKTKEYESADKEVRRSDQTCCR